jgi:two-component system sensor histidine kinase/response regulator
LSSDRIKALSAGMDDYMTKPIDSGELARKVERWVQQTTEPDSEATRAARFAPSASEPPSGDEVLDAEVVSQLKSLGSPERPHFFRDLIARYAEEARNRLVLIQTAITDNSSEDLRSHAHALKSSSRAVGALETARLCDELETLARSGRRAAEGALIAEELPGSVSRAVGKLRAA